MKYLGMISVVKAQKALITDYAIYFKSSKFFFFLLASQYDHMMETCP